MRVEHKVWENEQYSRMECLSVLGVPSIVELDQLEGSDLCWSLFFGKRLQHRCFPDASINAKNIESCHRLRSRGFPKKAIVKCLRRKDFFRGLNVKKD